MPTKIHCQVQTKAKSKLLLIRLCKLVDFKSYKLYTKHTNNIFSWLKETLLLIQNIRKIQKFFIKSNAGYTIMRLFSWEFLKKVKSTMYNPLKYHTSGNLFKKFILCFKIFKKNTETHTLKIFSKLLQILVHFLKRPSKV